MNWPPCPIEGESDESRLKRVADWHAVQSRLGMKPPKDHSWMWKVPLGLFVIIAAIWLITIA